MKIKKFNENIQEEEWDDEDKNNSPEKKLHDEIFRPRFGQNPNIENDINDNGIKDLEDYTDEEKIEKFDKLYKFAMKMLVDFRDSDRGEPDDDDEHYAWEELMGLLVKDRRKFWKYYNSLY